jgi:protein-tyrosine phosphatase
MIDIHCHLLHEIDDGAQTLEEALSMVRIALDEGVQAACVTPHLSSPAHARQFCARRDRRLARLREELRANGTEFHLFPGAEVFADDELFYAGDLRPACLGGGRFLLVEFGMEALRPARLRRYLDEVRERGLVPIVAHAERYAFFQQDYDVCNELCDEGVLFQVNLDALAGFCGTEEGRLAQALAARNMAQFLATDAHGAQWRPPRLRALRGRLSSFLSEEQLRYMTETAPLAVLKNAFPPEREHGYLDY